VICGWFWSHCVRLRYRLTSNLKLVGWNLSPFICNLFLLHFFPHFTSVRSLRGIIHELAHLLTYSLTYLLTNESSIKVDTLKKHILLSVSLTICLFLTLFSYIIYFFFRLPRKALYKYIYNKASIVNEWKWQQGEEEGKKSF
jgi:hypothetical protein